MQYMCYVEKTDGLAAVQVAASVHCDMLQSDETAVADNRAVGGEAACLVLRTQRHHEVITTVTESKLETNIIFFFQ